MGENAGAGIKGTLRHSFQLQTWQGQGDAGSGRRHGWMPTERSAMAVVESSSLSALSDRLTAGPGGGVPEVSLALRVKAALATMLDALDYVRDLDAPVWDFAVDLVSLRRLDVTNSDLRWLVARGFVDHAIEVTMATDAERSFRQPSRPLFCRKTCFVLTPAGAALRGRFPVGANQGSLAPSGPTFRRRNSVWLAHPSSSCRNGTVIARNCESAP